MKISRALVFFALMAATLVGTFPHASAAPTFGTERTIGVVNQDNNYAAYSSPDGTLVVIAHTVDSSNILVVEVSVDGGANFETRGTGITAGANLKVVAADAAHIVVLSGGTIIRTTTNGYTWASTSVLGGSFLVASLAYSSGTYVVAGTSCAANSGGDCLAGPGINPEAIAQWRKSTDHGATWSTAVNFETLECVGNQNAGFGELAVESMAIAMSSATAWEIFYDFYSACTSGSPAGPPTGERFYRIATTNGGTSYTGKVLIDDQFGPISPQARYVAVASDGNSVSFIANNNNRYAAQNIISSDLWSFSSVGAASPLGLRSPVFTCSVAGKAVIVAQGASGSDRLSYGEASGSAASLTTILAGPETVARPYAAYQIGANITAVYGDLTNGKTLLKSTTNSDCSQVPTATPVAGPIGEVVIAPLVGFDVSASGAQILTREGIVSGEVGRNIKLYNGNNLAAGPVSDTLCNLGVSPSSGIASASIIDSKDGVNTGSQLVSFYKCASDDHQDISQIRIRKASASSFSDPDFPDTCEGACYADIPDEELQGDDNVRRELTDLQEFPYDYSRHDSAYLNRVFLSWAFSTSQGDLGVVTLAQTNGATDSSDATTVVMDPTGILPIRVCSTRDTNNDFDYLYGVTAGATGDVKGFRVDYDLQPGSALNDPEIGVSLSSVFLGGQVNKPFSISCAENKLMVSSLNSVRIYTIGTGAAVQQVSTSADVFVGSALDPDALTGAFVDGDEIKVFRVSTGTVFGTYAVPTYDAFASPCGMHLTRAGPNQRLVWGACGDTGKIAVYDVTPNNPFSNLTINPSTDTDGDGEPNAVDNDIDGDGVENGVDPDADGDGQCNGATATTAAVGTQPAGTEGAEFGCTAGDTDNDADGLPNDVDSAPGGTGAGPGAGGGSGGDGEAECVGMFCLTRKQALFSSMAFVLVFAALGWTFTVGRRPNAKGDEE